MMLSAGVPRLSLCHYNNTFLKFVQKRASFLIVVIWLSAQYGHGAVYLFHKEKAYHFV